MAACSSPTSSPPPADGGPDAPPADVPVTGDAPPGDAPVTGDAPAGDAPVTADAPPADAPPARNCGTERPSLSGISGTEGLVIARDGTIYYSQSGGVGRITADGTRNNAWLRIAGASTVWGLAIDATRQRLYVGSPASRTVYSVNLAEDSPTATPVVTSAGQPNGLTVGPDGALYYSDFSGGHVYRVSPEGMRTQVTTSTISGANGVAFGPDGSLYVDSYSGRRLIRLTLDNNAETGRTTVATGLGSPDGLAFDAMGRIYVTDNGGGRLIRLNPDGSGAEDLLTGLTAPASIEFGSGSLYCTDIYVATGRSIERFMGDANGAAVPWH